MDRALLEEMLAEGLSLAAIGRRLGRHESTVAYWLDRYGLRAVHAGKHAARGALTREQLEPLVRRGMSVAQVAAELDRSKATVRHWLKEFDLETVWATRRRASSEDVATLTLDCSKHGPTTFRRRRDGGYRCARCQSEAVTKRRRRVKELLVAEAGGACVLCGYDRWIGALEFHHVDPAEKRFSLSHRGVARSIARARAEASKCVLVCANCHAEIEGGVATVEAPPP
jgi:transposase